MMKDHPKKEEETITNKKNIISILLNSDDSIVEAIMGLLRLNMMRRNDFRTTSKIKKNFHQIKVLQKIFSITSHPSYNSQVDLSILLRIPQRSIQIWFQNARQVKKKNKEYVNEEYLEISTKRILEIIEGALS